MEKFHKNRVVLGGVPARPPLDKARIQMHCEKKKKHSTTGKYPVGFEKFFKYPQNAYTNSLLLSQAYYIQLAF